jgi:hypothetical protein
MVPLFEFVLDILLEHNERIRKGLSRHPERDVVQALIPSGFRSIGKGPDFRRFSARFVNRRPARAGLGAPAQAESLPHKLPQLFHDFV